MHAPDEAAEVEPLVHREEVCQSPPRVTPKEEHKPDEPVDREREAHQQEVADKVEKRQEIKLFRKEVMEEDHRQVGQVLVIEELREADVQLGRPVVEGVLAARQCLACPLGQQEVKSAIVQAWKWRGELGEERDCIESDGNEDQQQEKYRRAAARRDRGMLGPLRLKLPQGLSLAPVAARPGAQHAGAPAHVAP